jgi:hypothetical protein
MSNDFPKGIIAKRNESAPQWALCKLSFRVDEFIQTLQENNKNGWCNLEVNMSQAGKPYVKFDTWEPNQGNPAHTGYVTRQAPPPPPPAPFPADDNIPGLGSEQDVPF